MCDFDWDHHHTNRSGEIFKSGIVHVQLFKQTENGKWFRDSKNARYMSNEEMLRYGELLKLANSKVKLRP